MNVAVCVETQIEKDTNMEPPPSTFDHTHRYSSYLLDLSKHWAYETKTPGRNKSEKKLFQGGK